LAESVSRFAQTTAEVAENERHRLDATLQAAPVGIVMVDKAGKVVLANAENRRLWGDVPLTQSIAEYDAWKGWWADGSARQGRQLQPHEWAAARALKGEAAPKDLVEIEPFNAPGLRKTIFLHAAPIHDGAGAVVGAVVAQMDVTALVKAEAALRESEAKFRTIADAMPQMVWSALPDGFVDYCNQQWYDFTGTLESSAHGAAWLAMFHPDDQAYAWMLWSHCLATGELYEIQYRLRHHSGQYRWVLGRSLPVRDKGGKIIRWMGTCTDIHEQKRIEEELKQANVRKDEFLAMLAHELRNPLAPISTAAEILKVRADHPPTVRMAGEIITRQVRHMTSLVDDLLDVSRVTRGLIELQAQTMDLKLIVDSAVEQVQPLMEARHHELELRLCEAPAYVRGDKMRLIQVLSNLLNNAAKYTAPHGQITLALRVEGAQAHLIVSDNGSGIEPLLLPYVFDLFTQGERTPDREQGGLGLGLTLVKNITALHGGQVTAASGGPGKGSTFNVTLPLVTR
jgi:PAS domain S-box-containing protein